MAKKPVVKAAHVARPRSLVSGLFAKAQDGFENFVSRLGTGPNSDNTLSAGLYTFDLITRNRIKLEAAYRGSWIVGKIVDVVADDMTRAGITITTNEQAERIEDLQAAFSNLGIWQALNTNTKWSRLYGGSIAVMQIKGQDLATQLDPTTVAKGQFKGLTVYDRWQLNPDLTDVITEGPQMGLPKFYYIVTTADTATPQPHSTGQIKVHHSRVVRQIGIQLPFFQAITEMMWGESILERLWDRLISFDNATLSSASLIDKANLRMVGVEGLRDILSAGGPALEGLLAQFDMMRQLQVNEGVTLLDKEDEYASTAYSFAGLSDMMLQFSQQLSGAADIPLIRLFSQSPTGMNATGDGDIRMYYDSINAQQNARLRAPMETIVEIMWRSTFGDDQPEDLQFVFTPLWQMSATDKAAIAKSNTETVGIAFEAGLASRAVAMKELRQHSGETGLFGNITDEDIEDAEDDEPPVPGDVPGEAAAPAEKEEKADKPHPLDKAEDAIAKDSPAARSRITDWLGKRLK